LHNDVLQTYTKNLIGPGGRRVSLTLYLWSNMVMEQTRTRKHKVKKLYLLICIVLFLSGIGSGISFLAYLRYNNMYHTNLSLAQTGMQHLHKAATLLEALPFDASVVKQAQQEFSVASTDFVQLNTSLTSL